MLSFRYVFGSTRYVANLFSIVVEFNNNYDWVDLFILP
jgi:hypothetical protein